MNEISPTKIVVIHDNIEESSPIMVEMSVKYGSSNILLFKHSQVGLDHVLNNLGQKMVVLLDKNFYDGKEIDGIKVFEKIREKTSLVYVILVTVSKISEIDGDTLKMLINKDLFKLESFTADYKNIIELVDEARKHAARLMEANESDVVLDKTNGAFHVAGTPAVSKSREGHSYSMNDILDSIRKQTKIGVTFQQNLLKLAIELFSRQKLKIDD